MGAGDGNLIGNGAGAVFAGITTSHDGRGRVTERKIGEGAKIGIVSKITSLVVAAHVVAKTIDGSSGPDPGARVGATSAVTGGVGDKVEGISRVLQTVDLVGCHAISLAGGGNRQGVRTGTKTVGGESAKIERKSRDGKAKIVERIHILEAGFDVIVVTAKVLGGGLADCVGEGVGGTRFESRGHVEVALADGVTIGLHGFGEHKGST